MQQTQAYLGKRDTGTVGDVGECDDPLVRGPLEGDVHETQQHDLLHHHALVLGGQRGLREVLRAEALHNVVELVHVATVHGLDERQQPLVGRALQRGQDGRGQHLAEVVDVVAGHRGQGHVRGKGVALLRREVLDVGVGQEHQRGRVELVGRAGDLPVLALSSVEL